VIDARVPAGSIAFSAPGGELTFKPAPATLLGEYFRI
jgi:hypothetical protein